jgi:predicted nucleotidyltransferase component of viral defense system
MRIPVEFVEKDFWVTELLRAVVSEAAVSCAVAIFKGGTSLSKAYRIIERFSEDVDILPRSSRRPASRVPR